MRADFNGHTADDTAALLMHVYDAALADKLSASIKDTPYERATRLTTSMPPACLVQGGPFSLLLGMRFDSRCSLKEDRAGNRIPQATGALSGAQRTSSPWALSPEVHQIFAAPLPLEPLPGTLP